MYVCAHMLRPVINLRSFSTLFKTRSLSPTEPEIHQLSWPSWLARTPASEAFPALGSHVHGLLVVIFHRSSGWSASAGSTSLTERPPSPRAPSNRKLTLEPNSCTGFVLFVRFVWGTGSYAAKAGFELLVLLPLPAKCWDDRCVYHHAWPRPVSLPVPPLTNWSLDQVTATLQVLIFFPVK